MQRFELVVAKSRLDQQGGVVFGIDPFLPGSHTLDEGGTRRWRHKPGRLDALAAFSDIHRAGAQLPGVSESSPCAVDEERLKLGDHRQTDRSLTEQHERALGRTHVVADLADLGALVLVGDDVGLDDLAEGGIGPLKGTGALRLTEGRGPEEQVGVGEEPRGTCLLYTSRCV